MEEDSNVLQLLEEYCKLRSCGPRPKVTYKQQGGYRQLSHDLLESDSFYQSGSLKKEVPTLLATIVDSAHIADSPTIAEQNLQTQDEIIQRLVQLLITFGDDIEAKLKQNPALQQQLQNLNYTMFEKLTSTVQNLLVPSVPGPGSDGPVQQQRIAWAFEVTSRLSAVHVVQRRTVLHFGAQYIEQNHAGWIQQHGGWDEAFD
ncbi:PREDICTED: apoptosis facilitator Bcl-2-like protein 14 [Cyprinodon variegatus]|uniref:apoptosis facilitator Bcl-2-like protein 14 n=1 Tax=Cyprinodon variegatus TaxID=28743 RepID=UPI0007425BC6|nr:PREDICTED: apoptosis facilitator Bcl-2-like protein 14 [Cyprinodon variegatus]